ncbi:MAG: aldo/keto reductase [Akkermansiaceae bacterium]|nr:aldo/keto reductase [Akkermansiaceae bacterium]
MNTRPLGRTGLELPILSFGASSLGQEFRPVQLDEALASVRAALDLGMTFLDTSPFYGRGMSEVLLGIALRGVPRDSHQLCTKLGRYSITHFDFSAKRVEESVHVSLHRLGTDHLDVLLLHDVEFVPLRQIWEETLPAAMKLKAEGKVRAVGFSCYPMKTFHTVLDHFDVDCILSYNQYTLINAGPFSARLLTRAALPEWLKEPEEVKAAARKAAALCAAEGVDIAQLALQFSCENPDIATTVAGSANPDNIRKWAEWLAKPIPRNLLDAVLEIFAPVHNLGHAEGLPENN